MLLYLCVFSFFLVLYRIGEEHDDKLFLFLSILIPSLFEGLRNVDVGTDMLGYGSQWFEYMDEKDSVWNMLGSAQTPEYAYHSLIYVCKKISPNIHLFMTVCALIKMSSVVAFAYKMKDSISSILFLFSYYCFFYVTSFSMMRQGIAIAICIYSLSYFMNHERIKFLIAIFVAYLFHNSAILMALLIPIFYLRNYKYKYPIILGGSLFVYLSIGLIFNLVLMTPLFKSEMADLYLDSGVPSAKTNILISLVFIGYTLYLYRFSEDDINERVYYSLATSSLTLFFLLLSSFIEVAFRMSYYMFIVSVCVMLLFMNNSIKYKRIEMYSFVSLFLLHFYFACAHGLVGALDYKSEILGF